MTRAGRTQKLIGHDTNFLTDTAMKTSGVKRKAFLTTFVLFCLGGRSLPQSVAAGDDQPSNLSAVSEPLDQFLDRASHRVREYTIRFVDLTAEENKVIELFGKNGNSARPRNVVSQLVIYESERSRGKEEYRDVLAVDGKLIKEHEQRLFALMRALVKGDPDLELSTVFNESSRYDLGYRVGGFTLNQALPLRGHCRSAFHFELLPHDEMAAGQAIIKYEQMAPCGEAGYQLPLPSDLRSSEFRHRGQLWFDVTTAQLRREQQEVWVRAEKGNTEFCILRTEYDYAPSNFDLLLPRRIQIEIFDHARTKRGRTAYFDLGARVTMTYSAFSRLDVSTSWKAANLEQATVDKEERK